MKMVPVRLLRTRSVREVSHEFLVPEEMLRDREGLIALGRAAPFWRENCGDYAQSVKNTASIIEAERTDVLDTEQPIMKRLDMSTIIDEFDHLLRCRLEASMPGSRVDADLLKTTRDAASRQLATFGLSTVGLMDERGFDLGSVLQGACEFRLEHATTKEERASIEDQLLTVLDEIEESISTLDETVTPVEVMVQAARDHSVVA